MILCVLKFCYCRRLHDPTALSIYCEQGIDQWTTTRSNAKRIEFLKDKDKQGYTGPALIHHEASECPPDLLHLTKGVILKQLEQASIF